MIDLNSFHYIGEKHEIDWTFILRHGFYLKPSGQLLSSMLQLSKTSNNRSELIQVHCYYILCENHEIRWNFILSHSFDLKPSG